MKVQARFGGGTRVPTGSPVLPYPDRIGELALAGLTLAQQALAVSPFDTEDFQEGWRAFLEKRTPQFRGY